MERLVSHPSESSKEVIRQKTIELVKAFMLTRGTHGVCEEVDYLKVEQVMKILYSDEEQPLQVSFHNHDPPQQMQEPDSPSKDCSLDLMGIKVQDDNEYLKEIWAADLELMNKRKVPNLADLSFQFSSSENDKRLLREKPEAKMEENQLKVQPYQPQPEDQEEVQILLEQDQTILPETRRTRQHPKLSYREYLRRKIRTRNHPKVDYRELQQEPQQIAPEMDKHSEGPPIELKNETKAKQIKEEEDEIMQRFLERCLRMPVFLRPQPCKQKRSYHFKKRQRSIMPKAPREKVGRKPQNPHMELKLVEWIDAKIKQGINLTQLCIRQKAKRLSHEPDFNASKGWMQKFFKRHPKTFHLLSLNKQNTNSASKSSYQLDQSFDQEPQDKSKKSKTKECKMEQEIRAYSFSYPIKFQNSFFDSLDLQ